MRTLVVGDIHGCFDALTALVGAAGISTNDRLIVLGDFIDRGPRTHDVVSWMRHQGNRMDLLLLRGNHEVTLLAARQSRYQYHIWQAIGGNKTLDSYRHSPFARHAESVALDEGEEDWMHLIPGEHWRLIEQTLPWFETATEIFVHARVQATRDLHRQHSDFLYWHPFEGIRPHKSGKRVICGHSSQKGGLPANLGYAVCVDTFVHGGQWLTCLDVGNNDYWQANESGQTRHGNLAQLAPGMTPRQPATVRFKPVDLERVSRLEVR